MDNDKLISQEDIDRDKAEIARMFNDCYVCRDGIKPILALMPNGKEWHGEYTYIKYCFNCGRQLNNE